MSHTLKKNGFEHIPNAFTRKSIELISNYFMKSNFSKFEYIIHYDVVLQDDIIKHGKYYDEDDFIENFKINSEKLSMNLFEALHSENVYVNNENRSVTQISTNLIYNGIPKYQKNKNKNESDQQTISIRDHFDLIYVTNFIKMNIKLIGNLIFNNVLHNYLKDYLFFDAKIFINKPGCKNQEIHADAPNEDNMLLLIPLNDCDINHGTTVFYDNAIVQKYAKPDLWKLGNIDTLEAEMKTNFEKAQYKVPFKIGDAVLFNTKTFHNGTSNTSNSNRIFLSIFLEKKELYMKK